MSHDRPYVLISSAVSLDGCIDDASPERLVLSNEEDLEQVDALRAEYDAIMVGAGTLRADNPRLQVRSPERRAARERAGRSSNPLKVTLTQRGRLSPDVSFFQEGSTPLVYCPQATAAELRTTLGSRATVVAAPGDTVEPRWLLQDLAGRGIARLIIEGGQQTNSLFLAADLVDELRVAFAPFFVAAAQAPRLVAPAAIPYSSNHRLHLERVEQVGDMAVAWYKTRR